MATYVDLSHSIQDGMITFKGLPGPVICDYLSREASRSNYSNLSMDSPAPLLGTAVSATAQE